MIFLANQIYPPHDTHWSRGICFTEGGLSSPVGQKLTDYTTYFIPAASLSELGFQRGIPRRVGLLQLRRERAVGEYYTFTTQHYPSQRWLPSPH